MKTVKRQILEKKLKIESDLVKKDSLSVLKDFERIDMDYRFKSTDSD